jgi:hypothetical protein
MSSNIPHEELVQFIITAKSQTYAAGGGASRSTVAALLTDSHQLEYCAGKLYYRDIYFGQTYFVGQETVYHANTAIWSMCYAGGWTDQLTSEDDTGRISLVLQDALKRVPSDFPFRGPSEYDEAGCHYQNSPAGNVERFNGIEHITCGSRKVYELHYSGGIII